MGLSRLLYIFDLDGTLADYRHRLHYLDQKEDMGRWDKFYAASVLDQPISPTILLLRSLYVAGGEIRVYTGRSDVVREQTVGWLNTYCLGGGAVDWGDTEVLKMRTASNRTPDYRLKLAWYNKMSDVDKSRLAGVFEDRSRVVQMWREVASTVSKPFVCYQVSDGNF